MDAYDIIRRIAPVCDDLMGEATGKRPVQDWGAVNMLLVDAGRWLASHKGAGRKD